MKPVAKFTVAPTLPKNVERLKELAYNYWWSWNAEGEELFARIDRELWEEVNHNPVLLISRLPQEQLNKLASQDEFTSYLEYVYERFRQYMSGKTWFSTVAKETGTIAYFCAEFGINESFQNYSGGLGVLAGDHLKTASDLGLPLVGVGLLYQQGYFHQYLTQNGWQSEKYIEYDYSTLPLQLLRSEAGAPIMVEVDLPLAKIYAQVWKVNVGRVPLYLLDTNIIQNDAVPEYRDITDQLYGGTTETRIMQEMLLGIGGMRALSALGIEPHVIHINEGHAAFSALERTRMYMERYGLNFETAAELTRSGACFTTHTPVPAGNEIFTLDLMEKYFARYVQQLGMSLEQFFDLARQEDAAIDEGFSMTVLGLRMSAYRNGVSKLHGEVARRMWKHIWDHLPLDEIPITGITNGIHTQTWVAREMAELYDRYLGIRWRAETDDPAVWQRIDSIPSEELWRVHQRRRERLVMYTRNHLRKKQHQHITPETIAHVNECLDPDTFTIGFARRFATYKRSGLLFSNMERLARLLNNPERPVQIVITGKAHPRDIAGKEMMQKIVAQIRQYGLEKKIVFLEDYDMGVARFLVKGSDIWLNTPRRPYEASGTSGMKAALNGVLHCSILDGWWAEAYNGENGFAIGRGEDYESSNEQDMIESETLYGLLENTMVPLFYERNANKVPEKWVARMKNSIKTLAGEFSTTRMLRDYVHQFYLPAISRFAAMQRDSGEAAKELSSWKQRVRTVWSDVKVQNLSIEGANDAYVGKRIHVSASVELGALSEKDVLVQLYFGTVDSHDNIINPRTLTLECVHSDGSLRYYEGNYVCEDSGVQGATVRIFPSNPLLVHEADMLLCTWAE